MSDQAAYDVESILLRLKELVEAGRSMPMSASVLVNREEFLELLEESIATLPQELRHSGGCSRSARSSSAKLVARRTTSSRRAAVRAERMVERTEVVREARRVAQSVVDDAEASGRQLRHEAEDYVDQKLAAFEVVLERTMHSVQKGRERLQVVIEPEASRGRPRLRARLRAGDGGAAGLDRGRGGPGGHLLRPGRPIASVSPA